MRECLKKLVDEITEAEQLGYELFFIDESFFFGQDKLKTAWRNMKFNLIINEERKDQKKVGVMGAISAKSGQQLCHLRVNKFFNSQDTVDFLRDLMEENQ